MKYHKKSKFPHPLMKDEDIKFMKIVEGGCHKGPSCFYKTGDSNCYFNVNSCALYMNDTGTHYEYNPIFALLEALEKQK